MKFERKFKPGEIVRLLENYNYEDIPITALAVYVGPVDQDEDSPEELGNFNFVLESPTRKRPVIMFTKRFESIGRFVDG